MGFGSMTDTAIAAEIGQRIEQLRLEQNITQQQLADAIGISRVSYGKLVGGQGKFINIIATLRVLGQLERIESLVPDAVFSPMEQLKMKGKKRKRAAGQRGVEEISSNDESNPDTRLDW